MSFIDNLYDINSMSINEVIKIMLSSELSKDEKLLLLDLIDNYTLESSTNHPSVEAYEIMDINFITDKELYLKLMFKIKNGFLNYFTRAIYSNWISLNMYKEILLVRNKLRPKHNLYTQDVFELPYVYALYTESQKEEEDFCAHLLSIKNNPTNKHMFLNDEIYDIFLYGNSQFINRLIYVHNYSTNNYKLKNIGYKSSIITNHLKLTQLSYYLLKLSDLDDEEMKNIVKNIYILKNHGIDVDEVLSLLESNSITISPRILNNIHKNKEFLRLYLLLIYKESSYDFNTNLFDYMELPIYDSSIFMTEFYSKFKYSANRLCSFF